MPVDAEICELGERNFKELRRYPLPLGLPLARCGSKTSLFSAVLGAGLPLEAAVLSQLRSDGGGK